MKLIKPIYEIIKREINWIIKDLDLIAMLLAAPLFYSFFYGTMYMNKVEHEIPVAVYDEDNSSESINFITDLNAHPFIKITAKLSNINEFENKLIGEEVQSIIIIPRDFSKNILLKREIRIKVLLNTHRFLHSNDLNKAVNEVALSKGEELRVAYFNSQGFSDKQAKELANPIKDEVKLLFNPSESYGDFMIPAILVLVLQQTLFMGLGQSMAKENETKSFYELNNLSSGNSVTAVFGKVSFYIILYLVYSMIFFTIHLSIFKVNFEGSYTAFLLLSFLLLLAISFLSLIIGNFFSKKVYALILISFTTYPIFFFTGYSWPTFAMPPIAQSIGYLIPTTSYLKAIHRIISFGAQTRHLLPEITLLLTLNIIFFVLTLVIFKRKFSWEKSHS